VNTKEEHQKKLLARLRKVEGQIRGIQGMIEKDSSCEAVAQQLSAARKALDRAFYEMVACSMEMEITAAPDLAGAHRATEHVTQLLAKYG
jgi:DNA-binding FrmR family transcriptional regulator